MLITPASAVFFGPDLATPAGGIGTGFSESLTWSGGTGVATTGNAFLNSVVSPFGGPFFGAGFGPCGLGGFGGLAQDGIGTNFGAENSAMGTFSRTTSFGLGESPGVVFGIPVAGPGGLVFC